jgi:hypothetical protein
MRYPFTLQAGELIGYSGILFEEAMFTILAEKDIYVNQTGNNRKFTKYINKSAAIIGLFEPLANGKNLDGTNTNTTLSGALSMAGCVNFKDYILDMRTGMSGIFLLMASDTEHNILGASGLKEDYFQRYHGNNPSGAVGNWVHATTELGASGLYDIDLREVQFQPIIRSGPLVQGSGLLTTAVVGPIFPAFCSTTGGLPQVSVRDLAHIANMHNHVFNHRFDGILLSGYQAADAGQFFCLGDVFQSGKSELYYAFNIQDGQLKSSSAGLCSIAYDRNINQKLTGGAGRFNAPSFSLTSGIYRIFFKQSLETSPSSAMSGIGGFWPPEEKIFGNTSGCKVVSLNSPGEDVFMSGFHIFDDGFWVASSSGAALLSPINGRRLWHRFADQQSFSTTNAGPYTWSDISHQAALPITGQNQNLNFFVGITDDLDSDPVLADRRFIFATFNPDTLDFISATETPGTFAGPSSPPSINKFWFCHDHSPPSGGNATNLYILAEQAELSSGPETYFVDTAFNNRGAMEASEFSPICLISRHLYGYNPYGNDTNFTWTHICIDNVSTFPAPIGSGYTTIADAYHWESRDTKFAPSIASYFEPISSSGFSFGGNPTVINPVGTDWDALDGSVLVIFQAKMKNSTILRSYLGRINESSSGTMDISQFWLLENPTINWIYTF